MMNLAHPCGRAWLAALTVIALAAPAPAQDAAPPKSDTHTESKPDRDVDDLGIHWQRGPATGHLGTLAEIAVPEGYRFADADGAKRLLEANQNLTSGDELGVLMPIPDRARRPWYVFFEYADIGFVKDEEKDELDADKLLASLEESNGAGNEERKRNGWDTLEIVGWYKPPFYDPKTNDLTWATIVKGEGRSLETVNWSTRLLGRHGAMSVALVLGKEHVEETLPDFEAMLTGFKYVEGQRYAEFRAGDKIAEYGLTALVAGGAGLVAAKTGLLAKLWKFILIGAAAVVGWFRRLFGWGKKDTRSREDAAGS